MKLLKLSTLVLLCLITSCSDDDSLSMENYLTINGDTREIIKNDDPELKITKEIIPYSNWFNNIEGSSKVINLSIYDQNQSLISNFGDYNYGNYLMIRFVLPYDFSAGTYTTVGWKMNTTLGQKESFSEFLVLQEFVKNIEGGQKYNIKDGGNKWIVEFNNLKYTGDNNTAVISGRITLNK
jgi:hypothetical protein